MIPKHLFVVIAAYNEASVIADVIASLTSAGACIVVVDDGSSDATSEMALAAGATVVRHSVNLGQGAALQTGIDYALQQGARAIVTFDADGQHDPADLAAMVQPVLDDAVDVTLGSRFLGRAEQISRSRVAVLKLAILFTFLTTRRWFSDVHNGYRCLSRGAAQRIHIRHNQMAHASEILEQIVALKLRYREVPVRIVYTDYSKAKGQRMSNSIRIVSDLLTGRIK